MIKNFTLLGLCFLLVTVSCKKGSDKGTNVLLEQYFSTEVLNRNFIITLATDNSTDITTNYDGYTFVLQKTDYYHGPMQVTKDGNVFTGSWSCNDDYGKLTIALPAMPAEFQFLSREWRFTNKQIPELDFAPWGSNDPMVLHMHRQ